MSRVFNGADTGANETTIIVPPAAIYNNLTKATIALWLYPTTNNANETVVVKDPVNTYSIDFGFNGLGATTGTTETLGGASSTGSSSATNQTLLLNVWSHVVMTFNNATDNTVHIFINGVECTYETIVVGHTTPPDDSHGGWYAGNDSFDDGYTGRVAEFAIWNTVLSQSQITALAASTVGAGSIATANLAGYWHYCGLASPEPDSSGNGNSGALSLNPPLSGPNSPGYSSCGVVPPPILNYSQPDCRDYAKFPNMAIDVNGTETYTVPLIDSRKSGALVDSRIAGAPIASGTYPQNSRTPGTFGPGE